MRRLTLPRTFRSFDTGCGWCRVTLALCAASTQATHTCDRFDSLVPADKLSVQPTNEREISCTGKRYFSCPIYIVFVSTHAEMGARESGVVVVVVIRISERGRIDELSIFIRDCMSYARAIR